MHVDIGNNKICHNFSSIVTSAEIRDLNERVQQEHPQEGGGIGTSATPPRRVDPNAGVPPLPVEPVFGTARRSSLNLSRSSAGSRHSQQQQLARHHRHPKQSTTPQSRSVASPSPDEAPFQPPPPINTVPTPAPSAEANIARPTVRPSPRPMAAVASTSYQQGGNWNEAAHSNGTAGGENGVANGTAHNINNYNANNKMNVDGSRRADEVAAGSQDNNGSGNHAKPAYPAGPKLAQTKIQLGMRLHRWMIINRIGAGSFGETFTAMEVDGPIAEADSLIVTAENLALLANLPPPEERHEVCIKVEQENKNVLRLEALALKKVQPCQQVVRYLGSGCIHGMNYLVMEKLGPNLAELRRRSQHGTFNIYTTLKAGISCLTAIRGVHDLGLVHRDIKPSNFVTGLPIKNDHTTCYLIDFGLARRFRRSNGEIRPPRDNAGFRGTSRYASVASHHHQELGRVDDLWSLLFMLVEFATGTLPWRKYKDKDDIGRCKEESITPHLVRNLPREFQPFLAHLQTLRYEDEPDYDLLSTLMLRALERRGYPPNKPVEWEVDSSIVDYGANADAHEAGARNDAEKAPQSNAAASPVLPFSAQQQQHQHPQPAANSTLLHDAAVAQAQQLRVPPSTGGLQTTSAVGASNRSTAAALDITNAQADSNNATPQQYNSRALRVSDVDLVGVGGGESTRPAVSIPSYLLVPQAGAFEEPGGASGFPAEGSETPAPRDSYDEVDPNEFSSLEQLTPANGDRGDHRRSGRRGSASAAASPSFVAPVLPPNSALEPNNLSPQKKKTDSRGSGQLGHPHDNGNGFIQEDAAMAPAGNATMAASMGGPAVDLDALNNDNVEVQKAAKTSKKEHAKEKKKSNCDCAVM